MPHSAGSTRPGDHWSHSGPPTPILAASFLLAGLGTVVLGPLLPQLLHEWQLTDERGGLLLLAKFVGAFCGGVAVPRRLRLGLVAGHALAAAGFAAFALVSGLSGALPALFLTGLGLGEIIASANILAGRRFADHTGSALALLNFFFSLGAVSTGLWVAALVPRLGWRRPTLGLAVLFAAIGLLALFSETASTSPNTASPRPELKERSVEAPVFPQARSAATSEPPTPPQSKPLAARIRITYGLLLFLYGGLETCLTAWLTTFSLRFVGGHLLGGQSGFVVLWAALTAGRVLAAALMRRFPELTVQRVSLFACLALIAALSSARSATSLSLTCILLGIALAPVFPSTFALLLRHNVPARTAGTLLAVSGLGAALFPWLMGVVSTESGSLRLAMIVPALLIPAMLALTLREGLNPGSFFHAGGNKKAKRR